MKIVIGSCENDKLVDVHLSDERQSLACFLSILAPESIESFEISDLTDSKLPRILQRFTHLKSLSLIRCHALTDISSIRCCNIQELSIIKCADFHDLLGISAFKSLKILHVSGCDAFDSLPEELENMPALNALDLSYCDSIGWINLATLPKNLKILDMHGCWRADFNDADANKLGIVSLQIQDVVHLEDFSSWPVIPNMITQLRHSMTMRDGCGLDS